MRLTPAWPWQLCTSETSRRVIDCLLRSATQVNDLIEKALHSVMLRKLAWQKTSLIEPAGKIAAIGNLVHLVLPLGQRHDTVKAQPLIEGVAFCVLLGDRAITVIPPKDSRTRPRHVLLAPSYRARLHLAAAVIGF